MVCSPGLEATDPTPPSSFHWCPHEWHFQPATVTGIGTLVMYIAPKVRGLFNPSREISIEPHFGQYGCSYSPTSSTSNFSGVLWSNSWMAASASFSVGKLFSNFVQNFVASGRNLAKGLKVFYDCSGGNSRPSRLSGVGGGNFLGRNPNDERRRDDWLRISK